MVRSTPFIEPPTDLVPLSKLADHYDGVLCDVWGVLHNGGAAFEDAIDALCRYRASGGLVILITNAPRPNTEVYAQLARFGVPRTAFDTVITSGDVTNKLIDQRPDAPLFHFGPARDSLLLDGIANPIVDLSEAKLCLLTGPLDDTINSVDVYQDHLIQMRDNGVEMICANPDLVVRSADRLVLCAGSIAQRYAQLGGQVIYAGKPEPAIYQQALVTAARLAGHPLAKGRLLAIGDGLPTDIKGAAENGFDAYFITSGIHAAEFGDLKTAANVAKAVDGVKGLYSDIKLVGICDRLRWT